MAASFELQQRETRSHSGLAPRRYSAYRPFPIRRSEPAGLSLPSLAVPNSVMYRMPWLAKLTAVGLSSATIFFVFTSSEAVHPQKARLRRLHSGKMQAQDPRTLPKNSQIQTTGLQAPEKQLMLLSSVRQATEMVTMRLQV